MKELQLQPVISLVAGRGSNDEAGILKDLKAATEGFNRPKSVGKLVSTMGSGFGFNGKIYLDFSDYITAPED